ncbi:hypothetical protein LOAG_02961 [Loa loa]|uniref:Uncharacterized protein n=2 Tax=Loa loa TaxID=7209 RepID=A0A1S0U5Q0_LOALO|nr:hypothetical protein LOAG_02961 [Loa loa]EFO25524.2 hypothetical protein LOAG_02961 [Loa loa]
MEKAINSVKLSQPSSRKMNKAAFNKSISKTDKLVKLYKQLRVAITKLEKREISFGEDYDEQFEENCNRRLLKLTQKHLRIHKYLVRKGIFVNDTGETILPDVKPKLIITSTGVEDLNILLTEYVNQETDSEVLGCKIRVPYKHVTVNDVKMLVDKLKGTNTQLFRDDPLEFDQLIQNIACEVNKLVKRFIEDNHRIGLVDWTISDHESECGKSPSTSADTEGKEEYALSVPTWDIANMELHEACSRGELDCPEPENSGDIVDTEMSPTVDEEEEDGEACEDDAQDSANEDMANENNVSDDSCCIVEEQTHERCERSEDSDCCIIEDDERVTLDGIINEDIENIENDGKAALEGVVNDGIENMEANSVSMKNPSENQKEDMELDGVIVNSDDDCCIIDD